MGKNDDTGIGKEIRAAIDGPTVKHDDLIDQIAARSAEEHARRSDSSESAAKVKKFLEKTSLNSQAFSWLKSILKKLPKKDGQAKAMDIIRSLEVGLPMIKNHVGGQETPDMLDGQAPETPGDDDPQGVEVDDHVEEESGDTVADEANVVTPIDFGGTSGVTG
jgi:hypothetical protein